MKTAIHIGNTADVVKIAFEELPAALMAILDTYAGDEVKIAAIAALKSVCSVDGASLSHCNIEMPEIYNHGDVGEDYQECPRQTRNPLGDDLETD